MTAEPTPIVPMDDGNFTSNATETIILGECRCPGRPHEEDTAEVYVELPWEVMVAVGLLEKAADDVADVASRAALKAKAYRGLILGALISWNLVDAEGNPVPISAVARIRQDRLDPIAVAVNAAHERAQTPLPNAPGAPSRLSRRASASPNPTRSKLARGTR